MPATIAAELDTPHASGYPGVAAASSSAVLPVAGFRSSPSNTAQRITPLAPHMVHVLATLAESRHRRPRPELLRPILESYTPSVDPDAAGGFYLNFFGSPYLQNGFPGTLRRLQLEILKETGLSVSIGAAKSSVAAVVASRLECPGGLRILPPGTEAAFFAPLPIEALHGLGAIDAADLRRRGISSIAELRRVPLPALQSAYGDVIAHQLWHHSRALDPSPSIPARWSVAAVLDFLASWLQEKSPCIATST